MRNPGRSAGLHAAQVIATESLHVKLPAFEGPLDLLYYLIRKHELNISEISLAIIADEFVASIEAARELNLAVAGNFLVIAATLMHMKSKWLLPPEEETQDGTDPEGQVAPLLQQLTDIHKLREIIHELAMSEDRARATFSRPLTTELERRLDQIAEHEPFVEMSAFELLKSMQKIQEFAFPVSREIVKEEITLEDKIAELFAIIKIRLRLSLTQVLNSSRSLLEAVVFFLAALELTKQRALHIKQDDNFGEIQIIAREQRPLS